MANLMGNNVREHLSFGNQQNEEKILGLEEVLKILLEENPEIRTPEELAKTYIKENPEAIELKEIIGREASRVFIKLGRQNIIFEKDLKNLNFDEENEYLVEKLIPAGSINMLGSKTRGFKTYLSLYLAVCIASGRKFLDLFNVKKGKVLYLDEENGLAEIKRRIEKIKNGLNLTEDLEIAFISKENLKISLREIPAFLENFIQEFKPDLIIVDVFARVFRIKDEKDAGEVGAIFTDIIANLTKKYGVSWLLLHHMRKTTSGVRNPEDELEELRGSSELANIIDCAFVLKRIKTSNRVNFIHAKARRERELDPLLLELNFDDEKNLVQFRCLGTAEMQLEAEERCAKDILKWIIEEDIERFKTREVVEVMKSLQHSRPTIMRALASLVLQGKIGKEKRGVYVRIEKTLEDFANEVSKSQKSQETNDTIETNKTNKEESIESIQVYSNDTTETKKESLESIKHINFETFETIETTETKEIDKIVEKESQKLPKILAEKKGLACYRCGSTEGLVQVEDFITHKPLWICDFCRKEMEGGD